MKQDAGDGKMKEISDHIYEGALAFLNAEYRLLTVFVLVVSAVLAGISFIVPTTHILIVVSFIFRTLHFSLGLIFKDGLIFTGFLVTSLFSILVIDLH